MSFLDLTGKSIVVFGWPTASRWPAPWVRCCGRKGPRSSTWCAARSGGTTARKLFPDSPVFVCDVEDEANIVRVRDEIAAHLGERKLAGLVHSIAFANYSRGLVPFHQTVKADFLQALDISCFSLLAIANHFKELLDPDASVVTISISTTPMAAENYGYMAPVKAALESSLCFPGQELRRRQPGALQRGLPGAAEDLGLGRHSRLYRQLSLRRKADPAQKGLGDRRGGQLRGLPAFAAILRGSTVSGLVLTPAWG